MNPNNKIKPAIGFGTALLLAVSLLYWLFKPQAIEVERVVLSKGPFVQTIEEDGKTRAKDVYNIIAPIQGELNRIELKNGDTVKKNQLLATIVPSRSNLLDIRTKNILQAFLLSQVASVKKAAAFVARAKAAMETAESDYNRNMKLAKSHFIAESELDQLMLQLNLRKKEYDAAIAELNEMKQRVEAVKSALSQFTQIQNGHSQEDVIEVRSPVDAQILSVVRKSAGMVAQGQILMKIADAHHLEIVADLLSEEALKISKDAPVIITDWGSDLPLKGHVRLVEPNAFTKVSALGVEEQRVNVIIDIDTPKPHWRQLGDGYGVNVEIIIFTEPDVIQVPISALFREGEKWAVFQIVNGYARKKIITIGRRNKDMALVIKGLKSGEAVINYPADNVEDGVAVYSN